ncbi:MAG: ABC transporter permease [Anaerolineaceae bacterium]|nr:ABC transporter permease [Anaerolineaceae bacterium]
MTQYIIRRLLILPFILFGVTILIFGMISFLSPSERAALYVRDIPRNEKQLDSIIKKYGLDDPTPVQYWRWMFGHKDPFTGEVVGGILRGDFGYSRSGSQPVVDLIKRRFPATMELAFYSIGPIILIGVWLGIIAAKNHNKLIDQVARVFSILGWSFPTFVFGLLVLMILYAKLQWFPPGRLSVWASQIVSKDGFTNFTQFITIDALLNGRFDIFLDALRHMVLPVITLSYLNWALYLRVTRSSMLETLGQDYITTARSKGLKERAVINKHAVPNALIPVVTLGGLTVAGMLGGVVITETIFDFPGMGSAAAKAAAQLDVITVLSFTLMTGGILILANLVVDIAYAFLDPRVRLG